MSRTKNAEIAEKVFGLKVTKVPGGEWEDFYYTSPGRVAVKLYSTTWEGMGLVLEKLEGMLPVISRAKGESWWASFERDGREFEAGADTAPMAVADAALKALENNECPSSG